MIGELEGLRAQFSFQFTLMLTVSCLRISLGTQKFLLCTVVNITETL